MSSGWTFLPPCWLKRFPCVHVCCIKINACPALSCTVTGNLPSFLSAWDQCRNIPILLQFRIGTRIPNGFGIRGKKMGVCRHSNTACHSSFAWYREREREREEWCRLMYTRPRSRGREVQKWCAYVCILVFCSIDSPFQCIFSVWQTRGAAMIRHHVNTSKSSSKYHTFLI